MTEQQDVKRKTGWAIRELNNLYQPVTLEQRAEDAYHVSVRLFELIERSIEQNEDDAPKRLMMAWFKSVKDKDFHKFRKALRKYENRKKKEIIS